MAKEYRLPEIGEGVVEGEIVEWHVAIGDQVKHDQPLVSILTDKATVEIDAQFSGVIVSRNGEPGDMVAVGGPVVTYDEAGSAPVAVPPAPKSSGQAQAQAQTKAAPAGTVLEFPLPEIGEGVVEGDLVEWQV